MHFSRMKYVIVSTVFTACSSLSLASPTYKADVPNSLITPDKVTTELLGDLEFNDAFPTDKTVKKTYDFLDTSRAVELYLNALPVASMYAMLNGHADIGFKANHTVGITEDLMNARSLWLTPQTTTPYVHVELDVKHDAVVLDLKTPVIGLIDDAFFHYVADVGMGGRDKGKGGKYLIIGPDFKGKIPKGYFVYKTKSYRHWLLMRVVAEPGKTKEAIQAFKDSFRVYPLSKADNPDANEFVNLSNKQYNTIHPSNEEFYDEINEVIQYEPADAYDVELAGLAASIGIKKGLPFSPDDRMKRILKEAAAIGNAAARSITFRPRNKNVYFYEDRQWYSPLAGGSHTFTDNHARVLDDRAMLHFYATGVTPFMVKPQVGSGSVYEIGATDKDGSPLDGSKTYSVTLPGPIPINNFWSFMVYDNHTRGILETDQVTGGLDGNAKGLVIEDDGSTTVFFSPKPPKGHEKNWVQTMPGKGFHVLLRLYGPLEPWFDKSWRPGDFELID